MGFKNHELFIERHRARFRGPFLEIGAKDYGSTVNLRAMLPGETYVGIDMTDARSSTDVVGDIQPIDEDLARIRISASWQRGKGRFLRGLGAGLLSLLGSLGLIAWLTRHRYLMPPTCIEMIGSAPGTPRPDA